jgi:hypothetical protein
MVVVAVKRAEAIAPRCAPAARMTVLGPASGSKGKGRDGGCNAALGAVARGGEGNKVGCGRV